MRRPGVGLSGLHRQQQTNKLLSDTGQALASHQLAHFASQFAIFKDLLQDFAKKHKKEIGENEALRSHFVSMCNKIGVDPFQTSRNKKGGGGFWTEILGLGKGGSSYSEEEFFLELGVQIVELCMEQRAATGGLVSVDLLRTRLSERRSSKDEQVTITVDDIVKAVQLLIPLESGYHIVKMGERLFLQSVPMEVSKDQITLIATCSSGNAAISEETRLRLGWSEERFAMTLKGMLRDGLVWIDLQHASGKPAYWLPCLTPDIL